MIGGLRVTNQDAFDVFISGQWKIRAVSREKLAVFALSRPEGGIFFSGINVEMTSKSRYIRQRAARYMHYRINQLAQLSRGEKSRL